MIEFTARDFDELCQANVVRAEILTLEEKRRYALRRFWRVFLGGVLVGIAFFVSFLAWGWPPSWGIILGGISVLVGAVIGYRGILAVSEDLKLPVLETLAVRGDLEYLPDGFEPPVFPLAGRALFGEIAGYSFTDLFHGEDAAGKRFAIYEGMVSVRRARGGELVFRGQVYAFQRRTEGARLVILPDRGIIADAERDGMPRVTIGDDPRFNGEFDVYAGDAAGAVALLDAELRALLLGLRAQGKVRAWVGSADVLVAVEGGDRFEPGTLFRRRPGEARVRRMFDDVCAALATLGALRARLA